MLSLFVSDLHGHMARYSELFHQIRERKPGLVFFGGDLLPSAARFLSASRQGVSDFIGGFLEPQVRKLREAMGSAFPALIMIAGNDDVAIEINRLADGEQEGLWQLLNQKVISHSGFRIFGYPFVPPTPFLLKDWEKFDVSRYVDPGCIEPFEGIRTVEPWWDQEFSTIREDLDALAEGEPMEKAVFLFHSPPYQTGLDRAALDGKMFDHVPLDVHIGSMAIRRFIEARQPMLCLHGHVHESSRITGIWKEKLGRSMMINAAWDRKDLSLVSFDLRQPGDAVREIIPVEG